MRFIDINGEREEHYDEVKEYARQRQEEELRIQQEKRVRKWVAEELEHEGFLKYESRDLMEYMLMEAKTLKKIFLSLDIKIKNTTDAEYMWNDFLLYNLNQFTGYFMKEEKRKSFIMAFSIKLFHVRPEAVKDFTENYDERNRRYIKYMTGSFSLEKTADKHFWRLICYVGKGEQPEHYIKEYIRFIYVYTLYLYLLTHKDAELELCKRNLGQYKKVLYELLNSQKSGRILPPDMKKLQNPLYSGNKAKEFQNILFSMKVILFSLDKKSNDEEGEIKMIEELYVQIQEQTVVFENLNSIIPEKINQDVQAGKLPEFHEYESDVLQENEKVHYLDHTVLYQGQHQNDEIQFRNYKGLLLFTDRRIIFKGEQVLDLEYEKIDRITEYDLIPEIMEITSGSKNNYFQLPNIETAYKILKLIANRRKGKPVSDQQVPLSYEEFVEKADIKAYIFAFEYMASGELPRELKEMLERLDHKLSGLQKTIEKDPQRKEEIYQFLHYYIPEAVKLVREYQSYLGTGLEDGTVEKVYRKVRTAVQALDNAVYQKILEIHQTSARDTMAGADALKEILGQDGYVDSAYTMNNK